MVEMAGIAPASEHKTKTLHSQAWTTHPNARRASSLRHGVDESAETKFPGPVVMSGKQHS